MTLGGVERGVVEIAQHLRACRVDGLVASAAGPLVAQLEEHGILHINLGLLRSKNPLNVLWRAPLALRRVIREHRVTLIHARSRTSAWSAWLAAVGTRARLVTTHHGAYGLDKAGWKRAVARVMLWGDGLILPSSFMLGFVCRHQGVRLVAGGAPRARGEQEPSAAHPGTLEPLAQNHALMRALGALLCRLHHHLSPLSSLCAFLLRPARWPLVAVIPRGVEVSAFQPTAPAAVAAARALAHEWDLRSDQTHVLHFGRLSPQKGGLDFLNAIHLVNEQLQQEGCEHVRALVVGCDKAASASSSHYDAVAHAARRCGGAGRAVIKEHVTSGAVPALLLCAQVVVVPSRTPEAFCRTVIEALAMGRRVVAYGGGGISEIQRQLLHLAGPAAARRLVLVDVGDVAALACEIASAVRLVRQEGTAGKGRLLPQRQISSFSSSLSGNSRMPASVSREEEEEGTRERDSLVVADCVRRLWDSERMCRDELAFYRKVLAQ
eukprot:Tamp_14402.p1 GENE.Tamp_14402~~Tamp_14402.p1  ORF type:complete len:532 (+),score=94.20 Tamp_14402:119-1597(+)